MEKSHAQMKAIKAKAGKDGFDSNKRWGNSATKGHGVNSPAMMEARQGFSPKFTPKNKKEERLYQKTFHSKTA